MRLHNFCVTERVEEEMAVNSGMGEVQPGRWEKVPQFDRDGRPVRYLDIERSGVGRARDRARLKSARRDVLVEAIAASGLQRPALRAGLHKKIRKKRGRQPRARAGAAA